MESFHDDVVVHRPTQPRAAAVTDLHAVQPPRVLARRRTVLAPSAFQRSQPPNAQETTQGGNTKHSGPRCSFRFMKPQPSTRHTQGPLSASTSAPTETAGDATLPSATPSTTASPPQPASGLLYLLDAYEQTVFPVLVQAHLQLCALHRVPQPPGAAAPHATASCRHSNDAAMADAVVVLGNALLQPTGELCPARWRSLCVANAVGPMAMVRTWLLLATVLTRRRCSLEEGDGALQGAAASLEDVVADVVRRAPPLLLPTDALQRMQRTVLASIASMTGADDAAKTTLGCTTAIHNDHEALAGAAAAAFPCVARLAATFALCHRHGATNTPSGGHAAHRGTPRTQHHGGGVPVAAPNRVGQQTPPRAAGDQNQNGSSPWSVGRRASSAGLTQFRVPFRCASNSDCVGTATGPSLPPPSSVLSSIRTGDGGGMVSTQLWLNRFRQMLERHQSDLDAFLAGQSAMPKRVGPASLRVALHAYFSAAMAPLSLSACSGVEHGDADHDDDGLERCAAHVAAGVPWPRGPLSALHMRLSTGATAKRHDAAKDAALLLDAASHAMAEVLDGTSLAAIVKVWLTSWHPDNVQSALNSAIAFHAAQARASTHAVDGWCCALRRVVLDCATANAQQIAWARGVLLGQ